MHLLMDKLLYLLHYFGDKYSIIYIFVWIIYETVTISFTFRMENQRKA